MLRLLSMLQMLMHMLLLFWLLAPLFAHIGSSWSPWPVSYLCRAAPRHTNEGQKCSTATTFAHILLLFWPLAPLFAHIGSSWWPRPVSYLGRGAPRHTNEGQKCSTTTTLAHFLPRASGLKYSCVCDICGGACGLCCVGWMCRKCCVCGDYVSGYDFPMKVYRTLTYIGRAPYKSPRNGMRGTCCIFCVCCICCKCCICCDYFASGG